jgi:hypothetical protein
MRNNYRHFIIAAIVIGITSIFAGSVHAQWQFVRADHDTAGHLTYFEERTRAGDVRIERKEYFRGTHIVAHQQRRTRRADGAVYNLVEQRDTQNRMSSSRTSNTTRRVS